METIEITYSLGLLDVKHISNLSVVARCALPFRPVLV